MSTALIKLHTHIYPPQKNASKEAVYLFIYPKNIETFELRIKQSKPERKADPEIYYSLHISMKQKPCLVFTKKGVLKSKPETKHCLDVMESLASVKEFNLNICKLSATTLAIQNLKLFQSTILRDPENRPLTDCARADLTTLYAGAGGKIIENSETIAHIKVRPPSYADSTHSTRSTSSEYMSPHSMIDIYLVSQVV